MKDIIIIGAGPAGMTAALYALRADKSVLLLEKENFKTDVNIAVENEEDCLTETLFNKLEDYTVFIIGKIGKNVFLSGFVLEVI